MWIVAINNEEPIIGTSFIDYLHHLQDPVEIRQATLILARRTCHTMTNFRPGQNRRDPGDVTNMLSLRKHLPT
eukprot:scaffold8800_cov58-Attheya_sp.AAC.5